MNTLQYKGYVALVEYDDADELFHGRVLGVPEVILIEGASVAELKQDLADGIDEYLEDCAAEDRAPSKPFSGSFRLRLGSELHKQATLAAAQAGLSLNEWIKRVVEASASRRESDTGEADRELAHA